jgi:ABC-type nitrate/sulfonate/bicarbonate transport system permease component
VDVRTQRDALLTPAVQLGLLLAVLGLWQAAAANRWVSPLILPSLTATLGEFVAILGQPDAHHAIQVTVTEFAAALAAALAAGLLVGAVCGTFDYLANLVEPLLLAAYAVPIVMAFPLCLLFFGIGSPSKIAFAGTYAFFPVAIQTMRGLRQVDEPLIRAARSMGASRWQLLTQVALPAASPAIATGLRLGAVLALLGVVAGEMLGAVDGIGQSLANAVSTFRAADAFAWILLVVMLVTLVNLSLSWLEHALEGER